MDRNELLQRINNQGKVLGYPLFVMKDGRILKTPPQYEPFKFIIFDELDIDKSLADQGIMKYETWLRRMPSVALTPQSPKQADLPEMFKIPPYLKPQIYKLYDKKVYIYAESYVRYWIERNCENGKESLIINLPSAKELGVKAEQVTIAEDVITKIYYYLH